ncbi:uncharacterized protein C8A04DRAFT_30235 [Dichotomopilus funicola]|uniref:Uncharacterized protein n=1 Tax=Dichotomopilus funicola TaxID=1934379 RepID=A0AAN6V0F1_9PEZI|nr:hypothetical protein C8A04DRAFT_30235 [Dichotomopilus funicola]
MALRADILVLVADYLPPADLCALMATSRHHYKVLATFEPYIATKHLNRLVCAAHATDMAHYLPADWPILSSHLTLTHHPRAILFQDPATFAYTHELEQRAAFINQLFGPATNTTSTLSPAFIGLYQRPELHNLTPAQQTLLTTRLKQTCALIDRIADSGAILRHAFWSLCQDRADDKDEGLPFPTFTTHGDLPRVIHHAQAALLSALTPLDLALIQLVTGHCYMIYWVQLQQLQQQQLQQQQAHSAVPTADVNPADAENFSPFPHWQHQQQRSLFPTSTELDWFDFPTMVPYHPHMWSFIDVLLQHGTAAMRLIAKPQRNTTTPCPLFTALLTAAHTTHSAYRATTLAHSFTSRSFTTPRYTQPPLSSVLQTTFHTALNRTLTTTQQHTLALAQYPHLSPDSPARYRPQPKWMWLIQEWLQDGDGSNSNLAQRSVLPNEYEGWVEDGARGGSGWLFEWAEKQDVNMVLEGEMDSSDEEDGGDEMEVDDTDSDSDSDSDVGEGMEFVGFS